MRGKCDCYIWIRIHPQWIVDRQVLQLLLPDRRHGVSRGVSRGQPSIGVSRGQPSIGSKIGEMTAFCDSERCMNPQRFRKAQWVGHAIGCSRRFRGVPFAQVLSAGQQFAQVLSAGQQLK